MRNRRFTILLIALIGLTLAPLLAGTSAGQSLVLGLAFLVVLVLGAITNRARPGWRWVAGVLAAFAAVAQGIALLGVRGVPSGLRLALLAAFLTVTAVLVLADVLKPEPVKWDKINGAICAYLLIGVTWGLLFALVRLVDPGAFAMPNVGPTANPGEPMIYYSFVTLTTLGFGDVTPLSHAARTLTWVEAVLGQIYLVVLVARLVSLHSGFSGENGSG